MPDIPASIVASGLSDAPLTTLVEIAMQRLVQSGVPIDRMNVGFRILHPLFDGMSITWTRETGAEVFYAALVDKEGSEFRLSPFFVMLSQNMRDGGSGSTAILLPALSRSSPTSAPRASPTISR